MAGLLGSAPQVLRIARREFSKDGDCFSHETKNRCRNAWPCAGGMRSVALVRCQLQPRVGSPSAWSRCLRSTTRSIGAPAIRRSCKRHCLIPRVRTGRANSFRRAGQRGRRRDRRLRAPTRFKDLHRPPILRAVRPLRPPPSLRRPRVRRQPVPLDCSLAPACRPPPWIPRRLEHRPPRRYRLCLHSSP